MLPFHRVGKHSVLCEGSKAEYRIEHHQFHVAFFFANGFLGISPRQLLLLGRNKRKKWDKNGKNALLYDIHGKEFQGIFFLTLSHLMLILKLDRKSGKKKNILLGKFISNECLNLRLSPSATSIVFFRQCESIHVFLNSLNYCIFYNNVYM